MQTEHLRHCLESQEKAQHLLTDWGLRDAERGQSNLKHLAEALGLEVLADLGHPLARVLPRCPDADMALNNFERFLASHSGRHQLPILLEGRARTLETVLQLFSTSQFFSDLLIANPDYLEMLRIPLRAS